MLGKSGSFDLKITCLLEPSSTLWMLFVLVLLEVEAGDEEDDARGGGGGVSCFWASTESMMPLGFVCVMRMFLDACNLFFLAEFLWNCVVNYLVNLWK